MDGYIYLYRTLKNWRWYKHLETRCIFIDLLLSASYQDRQVGEITLEPGQVITSIRRLSADNGISERSVRTSLNRLEKTGELTQRTTHRYTIITLANWASYQSSKEKATQQTTSQRHSNDTVPTTYKKDKKEKKEINIRDYGFSDDVLQALDAMIEMRTAIKSPMTQKAVDLMVAKLNDMAASDAEKIAILNQSVMNNWKGIFPLKEELRQEVKPKNYVN